MAKKRCNTCVGSGRVMGGGMMMQDCEECDGLGKIFIPDDPIDYLEQKNSEAYQNSKKEIKKMAPDLTDENVEKILDEEFAKLNPQVVPINKKTKKEKGRNETK